MHFRNANAPGSHVITKGIYTDGRPQACSFSWMERAESVKRKRKVRLEIEHREITLVTGPGGLATPNAPGAWKPGRQVRPAVCPTCGATGILLLPQALTDPVFTQQLLQQSAAGCPIHLGRLPSGEWWVCNESIHRH